MGDIERISISFSKFLLEEIDRLINEKGYSSRSELIRDAVRKMILENNTLDREGIINGIIIVVYYPTKENLDTMSKLYFEYHNLIKSVNQGYITTQCGKNMKVEMFIVEGKGKEIKNFYESIKKLNKKIYDKIVVF
ncbi:CopG family ribbon-helix-helix protein [Methanocaldococcus indicus]|uniref:CopG family ribbon-helix-helix protein n=1 Tax=Methanocaldococcus indicus TaxID=213231 RepID=UPI003C6D2E3F